MTAPPFPPTRVLVPVDVFSDDGRELGRRAIDVAGALVAANGEIIVATALPPPFPFAGVDVSHEIERTVRAAEEAKAHRAKDLLDELASTIPSTVKHRIELLGEVGGDASRIVNTAVRVNAELIVITSHHRRGISRLLLGSVAEKVAHLSHVPVLLLPPPA